MPVRAQVSAVSLQGCAQPRVGVLEERICYDGVAALFDVLGYGGGRIAFERRIFDEMVEVVASYSQIAHFVRIVCVARGARGEPRDAQDVGDKSGMIFIRDVEIAARERQL